MTCCSFLSPSAILDIANESKPKTKPSSAAGERKRKGQQEQVAASSRSTNAKAKKEPDMVNSSKSYVYTSCRTIVCRMDCFIQAKQCIDLY